MKLPPEPKDNRVDLQGDQADRVSGPEFTHNELTTYGEALAGAPSGEFYNGVSIDKTGTYTGRRNPVVSAIKSVKSQLIQDGGGYSSEADPASEYTEATRFYCASCGEPIRRHAEKPRCEHPHDPCVLEAPRGILLTGCQSCREWWDVEQGYHRSGKGRQSHTCKPTAEDRAAGRKKSKCARLWDSEKRRAKREGREPVEAPPKLTKRDRIHRDNAILDAEVKARNAEAWRRRQDEHPGWYWELAEQRRRSAGTTNQLDPRMIPPERRPNGRHYSN